MLPPDLREWVPKSHLAHHVSGRVAAVDLSAFHAPYEGDGRRNSPYDPRMMVKVLSLRICDGRLFVAKAGDEAGGGPRVSDAGGGQLSAAPDAVRVPPPPSPGFRGGVRRGGSPGADDGLGGAGQGVGGRDEGSGDSEQAQGDELGPDGEGGVAAGGGDPCADGEDQRAVGGGRSDRRSGDELPEELRGAARTGWRRSGRRRRAGRPSSGRCAMRGAPQAWAEAQSEGRVALWSAFRALRFLSQAQP